MFPTPDLGRSPVDVGYFLPEDPEGHPLRCVSFLIPDTIEYRAALYRQVYDLGVTETWDRTDPQKAMLAAEVWTGALQSSFRLFEDGCVMAITAIRIDGCNLEVQIDESEDWVVIGDMTACVIAASPPPTIVRQDTTPPGNLQQNIGGAGYTDIPNTDLLWRNGLYPMNGGLEINPATAEVPLTIQPTTGTANYFNILNAASQEMAKQIANGDVTFTSRDTANASQVGAAFGHETSATPIAGFGTYFAFRGKSSTTAGRDISLMLSAWEVATHATRRGKLEFQVYDFSGAKKVLELGVTGASTPKIGFLGNTPQPRLALSGSCEGNAVLKSVAQLLDLFGLATDTTSLGTHPALTPFNVSGDKFGNEALASLITGLDTANIINDLTSDTGAYEYVPPPPIEVEGSWQGLEVGKALALALAENDYIVDLTEVNSTDDVTIDRRCSATAACRWMLQQLYYLAGSEMCYDNVAYVSENRWISVQAYVLTNGLHVETQDFMFERWADPLYAEFGENSSPVVTFAEHFDEMVAYLPTIEEAFYCSLTTSGILTSDGRLEFLDLMLATNLTGDVPQDIETWFYQFARHFSEVDFGLMIAAALQTDYASTIDCSAFVCASSGFSWCKQYNFVLGTYTPPFEIVSGDHVFGATFNPGWKTDDTGILRIEFPFPTNQVTIKYNVTIPDDAYAVVFGTIDGMFESNLSVEGGIYEETIEIPEAFRADGWYFRAACNPVNCVVTIKNVTNMQGTGTEPTDLNDC